MELIDKDALVAEIERRIKEIEEIGTYLSPKGTLTNLLCYIDTLEVKEINSIVNPYDAYIQYTDRESAIKAHAEDYSFNIESELFQQLTPEQQKLWRKEIEQAVISGGYSGLNLAKDPRYKENVEVKEVDLDALGVLAEHLLACDAHLVTPKYTDKELDLLEEWAKNNKAQKGE